MTDITTSARNLLASGRLEAVATGFWAAALVFSTLRDDMAWIVASGFFLLYFSMESRAVVRANREGVR